MTRLAIAAVTPGKPSGEVDLTAMRKLVARLSVPGVDAIVVNGSTGEGFCTSLQVKCEIIEATAASVPLHVRVLTAVFASTSAEVLAQSSELIAAGASGVLLPPPAYIRPRSSDLERFYREVRIGLNVELGLYNIPGRCAVAVSTELAIRLLRDGVVDWIKESSGELGDFEDIALADPGLAEQIYCGDDALNLPMLVGGAGGIVSVVANAASSEVVDLVVAIQEGNLRLARTIDWRLQRLNRLMLSLPNPIGSKAVCGLLGLPAGVPLPPLGVAGSDFYAEARLVLKELGIPPSGAQAGGEV